jgi:hypothetical protein
MVNGADDVYVERKGRLERVIADQRSLKAAMAFPPFSVNQMFPSDPAAIPKGWSQPWYPIP